LPDTVPAAKVADALIASGTGTAFPSRAWYSVRRQSVPSRPDVAAGEAPTVAAGAIVAEAVDAAGDAPPVVAEQPIRAIAAVIAIAGATTLRGRRVGIEHLPSEPASAHRSAIGAVRHAIVLAPTGRRM
jgi:hypothetical protein